MKPTNAQGFDPLDLESGAGGAMGALGIGLICIFYLIPIAVAVFWSVMGWRTMRASERSAQLLEYLANQKQL